MKDDPDGVATIVEGLSIANPETGDTFASIKDIAERSGMPSRTADRIVERMRKRHSAVTAKLRKVTTKELLAAIEDRAMAALEFLTDEKLAESSGRDLAVIFGILSEKRQLLRGEPTQILSIDERKNLSVLVPQLIKEAERRHLTVDMTNEEYRLVGGRNPNNGPIGEEG